VSRPAQSLEPLINHLEQSQQSVKAPTIFIRNHALKALSSLSLLAIAILLIPQAVKNHRYNRCIDRQIAMRADINPQGGRSPGMLNYLKAVEHCEGS
jgi:hypothetical protein|tara:strand:+ start:732 stop:1022 length:291 start_codon:yes stop_codon:yes gene_type:complete